MKACVRPGGGMQEGSLDDAKQLQREENDEIFRNAGGEGVRMHQMAHAQDPRDLLMENNRGREEPPLNVGMRQFPVQFQT